MSETCPVCNSKLSASKKVLIGADDHGYAFSCPRCGDYHIDSFTDRQVRDQRLDIQSVAVLSHWIRTEYEAIRNEPPNKGGYRREKVFLNEELVNSIIKNPRPSLPEQVDNFIRWIGDNIKVGGEYIAVEELAIQAIVASATSEEFELVFDHLGQEGLIEHRSETGVWRKVTLPWAGWERYRELKRSTTDSRKAFMAMQYGKGDLDAIVENVFKPAVKQTGFDLSRLDDPNQPAGLMDDRLRVEIRTSRFLIADLTHENRGAYWEAGYAEGLEKPVIYTCEKKKFRELQTHFDTNHHLTILWDSDEPEKAGEKLKSTIRATLPAEAKLTDD